MKEKEKDGRKKGKRTPKGAQKRKGGGGGGGGEEKKNF